MKKTAIIFYVFLNFLLLFVGFFHPITAINEDLGRHLLLGQIITQTHSVPKINLLSYTYPQASFINSHWLSEVIFFFIYQQSGFNGLLITSVIISLATFSLLFFFATKKYYSLPSVLAIAVYIALLLDRTDIRPEIFSYFFLSIFLIILYQYRSRFTKFIFLLIPLEILWTNMHIYFVIGILTLTLFLIDMVITNKFRFTKDIKILAFVLFFAVLGTCINPNGIQGALFPLTFVHNYGLPVEENQNIFLIQHIFLDIIYFCMILGSLFILLTITYRKTPLINWFLFFCFGLLAIIAVRNVPLFLYATFILFFLAITNISSFISKYLKKNNVIFLRIFSISLFTLLVLSELLKIVSIQGVGFGVDDQGRTAINFFQKQHLTGPLYNNFLIGSYLTYRLYPQEKVFVDGRPEAYPKTFFQNVYIPMQINFTLFKKTANTYHFNALVIGHWQRPTSEDVLLNNLIKDPDYVLVYLDDYAAIFVQNSRENKTVILKNTITETTFHLPTSLNTEQLVRYVFLFHKIHWGNQEKTAYTRLSVIDPSGDALQRALTAFGGY